MSCFDRFNKKEKLTNKSFEIDENLYLKIEQLSKNVYDASITELVNAAIEEIIKKEDIKLYKKDKNISYIKRSFLIRSSILDELYTLKEKYGISMSRLVNIAIRNALIEEGIFFK